MSHFNELPILFTERASLDGLVSRITFPTLQGLEFLGSLYSLEFPLTFQPFFFFQSQFFFLK